MLCRRRIGWEGDVTVTHMALSSAKFAPDSPTPVIHRGWVFTFRDDGMACCLAPKTGGARWQERLFADGVKVSPVPAEGRVYSTGGQGNCVGMKAAPKFEVPATNPWNDETLGTPALSDGQVIMRSASCARPAAKEKVGVPVTPL